MKWERNTVSLPVRVLFRKRRIFLPDKWNSWSNAREWDNAERMRWFSRTCDTSLCSLSRALISTRLQKRITGTKISHCPVRRYARVHHEATWCVIRCRLFGAQDIIRVRTHAHPMVSLFLFFRSLFSPATEIRAEANDSIHSVGFHSWARQIL